MKKRSCVKTLSRMELPMILLALSEKQLIGVKVQFQLLG
jgi:hypothetical protein